MPLECGVKTRYRQNDLPCAVQPRRPRRLARNLAPAGARRHARSVRRILLAAIAVSAAASSRGASIPKLEASAEPAAGGITYNSLFSVEGS